MERTNTVIPHLLQKQIEDFSKALQLFDENKLGINELCIKAHSVKGLALFYDTQNIKEKFLDIERYLFYARNHNCSSKAVIVMELLKRQQEIEKYIKSVNENSYDETQESKICLVRKAKKYVFVLNTLNRCVIKSLITSINEIVLITGVIQRFDRTYVSFVSNISSNNLKMLFSSFQGYIKEYRFGYNFIRIIRKNLIESLFSSHNRKNVLREGDIYVEDFMESVYQGLLNIANAANVKVNFKYSFNCEIISREVEAALTIPLLEILKNAVSHNVDVDELLIKLRIKVLRKSTVIKIYNDGKKINSKKLKSLNKSGELIGKRQLKKLSRKGAENIIFNSFFSTSNVLPIAGRGVGLFEARRLIEKHGGTIAVKNCYKGLEFSIYLPRFEAISQQ